MKPDSMLFTHHIQDIMSSEEKIMS